MTTINSYPAVALRKYEHDDILQRDEWMNSVFIPFLNKAVSGEGPTSLPVPNISRNWTDYALSYANQKLDFGFGCAYLRKVDVHDVFDSIPMYWGRPATTGKSTLTHWLDKIFEEFSATKMVKKTEVQNSKEEEFQTVKEEKFETVNENEFQTVKEEEEEFVKEKEFQINFEDTTDLIEIYQLIRELGKKNFICELSEKKTLLVRAAFEVQ